MTDPRLIEIFRSAAPKDATHMRIELAKFIHAGSLQKAWVTWYKYDPNGDRDQWFVFTTDEDGDYPQWRSLRRALPDPGGIVEFTSELIYLSFSTCETHKETAEASRLVQ